MNQLKITEPINSTDSEGFQEEVNRMINNSNKANEPRKAAQIIALDAWGRGSDRRTTGRLLSTLNTSKNKKPLTTTH